MSYWTTLQNQIDYSNQIWSLGLQFEIRIRNSFYVFRNFFSGHYSYFGTEDSLLGQSITTELILREVSKGDYGFYLNYLKGIMEIIWRIWRKLWILPTVPKGDYGFYLKYLKGIMDSTWII